MRVLLMSHLFPPSHVAGVEQYTLELARGLRRLGHDVAVACTEKVVSRPTGTLLRRRHDGILVFEVANNHDFTRYEETWRHPAMDHALDSILREWPADVVHAQHLMYWSVGSVDVAHRRGARFILTLHDYWLLCGRFGQFLDHEGRVCERAEVNRCAECLPSHPWRQPAAAVRWMRRIQAIRSLTGIGLDAPARRLRAWGAALRRRLAPPAGRIGKTSPTAEWSDRFRRRRAAFIEAAARIDSVITPSESLMRSMCAHGFPRSRFRHVAQGLDPTPFETLSRKSRERPKGPLRAVFVGQVVPHKGVHILLDAITRLEDGLVSLRIIGPPRKSDYVETLRRRARTLSNVTLEGPVSRAEVPAILADADLACVPSLWFECCPLTIQEAFMAGVPVVASKLGGMAELVEDGRGGVSVRPGDVEAWASVLRRLACNDAELRRLRATIPAVLTIDRHLECLLDVYRGQG